MTLGEELLALPKERHNSLPGASPCTCRGRAAPKPQTRGSECCMFQQPRVREVCAADPGIFRKQLQVPAGIRSDKAARGTMRIEGGFSGGSCCPLPSPPSAFLPAEQEWRSHLGRCERGEFIKLHLRHFISELERRQSGSWGWRCLISAPRDEIQDSRTNYCSLSRSWSENNVDNRYLPGKSR